MYQYLCRLCNYHKNITHSVNGKDTWQNGLRRLVEMVCYMIIMKPSVPNMDVGDNKQQ